MQNKNALLFFIKAPIPGTVKTRLQPQLTEKQCVIIYKSFVEDLLKQLRLINCFDIHIFFIPKTGKALVQKWLGENMSMHTQNGQDLGEKMNNAFAWAFKQQYEKVVLIGSDLPTLNGKLLRTAFNTLTKYKVVLGPTDDGGYYLIGMNEYLPFLFKDITWSTNVVFEQTFVKLKRKKISNFILTKDNDIDDMQDLTKCWEIYQLDVSKHHTKTYRVLHTIFTNRNQEKKHKEIFRLL